MLPGREEVAGLPGISTDVPRRRGGGEVQVAGARAGRTTWQSASQACSQGRAWLKRHPRVQLHFTPTSGSWLNLVEVFFSIITRQALRRGSFPTVADLIAAIGRFIDAWNDRCRQGLGKVARSGSDLRKRC